MKLTNTSVGDEPTAPFTTAKLRKRTSARAVLERQPHVEVPRWLLALDVESLRAVSSEVLELAIGRVNK